MSPVRLSAVFNPLRPTLTDNIHLPRVESPNHLRSTATWGTRNGSRPVSSAAPAFLLLFHIDRVPDRHFG